MSVPFEFIILAFLVGALVGLSELLSRYAWTLLNIITSFAGLGYLAVNGAVAVIAYLAAVEWGFHAGLEGKSEAWRVLVTSILGMAVLRSSIANIRAGDKEFAAGFAEFIKIFQRRAERSLDQKLSIKRWAAVTEVVEGLTYAATRDYLFAVSEGTLRSLSRQEIDTLQEDVAKIDSLTVNDAIKMQLLAMRIIEKTSLDLFVSFAKTARIKLASANELVAKQTAERLQRLAEAKDLLR